MLRARARTGGRARMQLAGDESAFRRCAAASHEKEPTIHTVGANPGRHFLTSPPLLTAEAEASQSIGVNLEGKFEMLVGIRPYSAFLTLVRRDGGQCCPAFSGYPGAQSQIAEVA